MNIDFTTSEILLLVDLIDSWNGSSSIETRDLLKSMEKKVKSSINKINEVEI